MNDFESSPLLPPFPFPLALPPTPPLLCELELWFQSPLVEVDEDDDLLFTIFKLIIPTGYRKHNVKKTQTLLPNYDAYPQIPQTPPMTTFSIVITTFLLTFIKKRTRIVLVYFNICRHIHVLIIVVITT